MSRESKAIAQLGVAAFEHFRTSAIHFRCVGELLAVENQCRSFLVKGVLVVAALVGYVTDAADHTLERVPVALRAVAIRVNVSIVVVNVLTISVDIDFDVGHFLGHFVEFLAQSL